MVRKRDNKIRGLFYLLLMLCYPLVTTADKIDLSTKDRWQLDKNNHQIILSVTQRDHGHIDNVEFAGLSVAAIIHYGMDKEGDLILKKRVIWPMLRKIPNDTHASLIHDFPQALAPTLYIDGVQVKHEKPKQITFTGVLTIQSQLTEQVQLTRVIFPSTNKAAVMERWSLKNLSDHIKTVRIDVKNFMHATPEDQGVYGSYSIKAESDLHGRFKLKPKETLIKDMVYSAIKKGEHLSVDVAEELAARQSYIKSLHQKLVLETPDDVVNQMFSFAKLRGAESIYATKGGLMHGPGGSAYYAAIWANDQAEYINPFFPFLGDAAGNESAINSFRHFARYMNDDYTPIPTSIIAEGIDIWNGAGDRGDCAMIAYGASRFALAYGKPEAAKTLLPLINWCIEFNERKTSVEGVVASDSDELEGRFESGDFNLSTNVLAYGGLLSAANLLRALKSDEALALTYERRAKKLAQSIDQYFGATVMGYDAYQYFKGNKKLRSWIAIPLTMGIMQRREATTEALLSKHLWTKEGILTEAGSETFWDRATLYAFRGLFNAQATDTVIEYFKYYSRKRLLGDHVPYAIEAWPEGNQRHLSAESGLYARVVTEGLFGIEPISFNRFELKPRLPTQWDKMALRHIRAFQNDFDIEVERIAKKIVVNIVKEGVIKQTLQWNDKEALIVTL